MPLFTLSDSRKAEPKACREHSTSVTAWDAIMRCFSSREPSSRARTYGGGRYALSRCGAGQKREGSIPSNTVIPEREFSRGMGLQDDRCPISKETPRAAARRGVAETSQLQPLCNFPSTKTSVSGFLCRYSSDCLTFCNCSPLMKVKLTSAGQPCRHCQTPVELKEHPAGWAPKPGRVWFKHWLKCPQCKAVFMLEEFRQPTRTQSNLRSAQNKKPRRNFSFFDRSALDYANRLYLSDREAFGAIPVLSKDQREA